MSIDATVSYHYTQSYRHGRNLGLWRQEHLPYVTLHTTYRLEHLRSCTLKRR